MWRNKREEVWDTYAWEAGVLECRSDDLRAVRCGWGKTPTEDCARECGISSLSCAKAAGIQVSQVNLEG